MGLQWQTTTVHHNADECLQRKQNRSTIEKLSLTDLQNIHLLGFITSQTSLFIL